jgi:hypothetical protein
METANALETNQGERLAMRLLNAVLLAIALTVTYCWCVRIADDLSWDEAASLRKYARHPLTAGAYMHDSNNHPGDSLFRSVFYGVLGLREPAIYRFAGFLILVGFLAAAWRWPRFLTERRATLAATVLVLLVFLSHAVHEQAAVLRGYFPSIVLEVVWFLLVVKWSGLLDREPAPAPPAITRGQRWKLAALSGLILFVLPSNALLMLILWLGTAMAFGSKLRTGRARQVLAEAARLGLLGTLCALVLYLPIIVTLALGKNYDRDALPIYHVVDVTRLEAIRDEVLLVLQLLEPGPLVENTVGAHHWRLASTGPVPDLVWAIAGGGLAAAAVTFGRRGRPARVACVLALATLAACATVAAFNDTPPRIRAPFVGPMIFAALFLAHDLGARMSARTQVLVSLALAALGCWALVGPVRATAFDRRASDVAAVLETVTRPAERHVLVLHDNQRNLLPYLHRAFGDAWTIDRLDELKRRFAPEAPRPPRTSGMEAWVREHVLPEPVLPQIRVEDIDVLVLVGAKETARGGAIEWADPALDAIRKRLTRVTTLRRDERDLEVLEKP